MIWRGLLTSFALTVLIGLSAAAIGVDEAVLADPAQEARARAIMKELRCLVCQNQSIEESEADMAADLRAVVRERVAAGETDAEIRAYLAERYQDWVFMRPPVNSATLILWAMPFLLLIVGGVVVYLYVRRTLEDAGASSDEARDP